MTRSNVGSKGFIFFLQFVLHHPGKSGEELKQGQNLEVGTDAEAMEGRCLLACSLWLAQPVFLYTPGPV